MRSRELSVCGGCVRRLLSGKGTCCYFYAGRELSRMERGRGRTNRAPECSNRYESLARRRMRTGVTTKRPCIVELELPRGRIVGFGSLIEKRARFGAGSLSSRMLVGASKFPACRFTMIISSRLVRVARIVEKRR